MRWFSRANSRNQRHRVLGVVKFGPGLASVSGEKWSLRLTLRPWRSADGAIKTTDLFLDMPTRRSLEEFAAIKMGEVVEVIVSGPLAEWPTPTRMIDYRTGRQDAELKQIYDSEVARTIDAPPFGLLKFEIRFDRFKGRANWRGTMVELTITGSNAELDEAALRTAQALFAGQDRWDALMRQAIVAELLPLKNDTWLEEDEAPLEAEEFLRRLTVSSVAVGGDGSFDFYFDDGDLFWGHAVIAAFDPESASFSVNIAG